MLLKSNLISGGCLTRSLHCHSFHDWVQSNHEWQEGMLLTTCVHPWLPGRVEAELHWDAGLHWMQSCTGCRAALGCSAPGSPTGIHVCRALGGTCFSGHLEPCLLVQGQEPPPCLSVPVYASISTLTMLWFPEYL